MGVRDHPFALTGIGLVIVVVLGILYLRPGLSNSKAAAHVSIVSIPSGATVLLDLDSIGVTPLPQHPLPSGLHILSIRKPGYPQLDTLVFIQDGDYALRVVLRHVTSGMQLQQGVTVMEPLQMGPLQQPEDFRLPIEPLARNERLQSSPTGSITRDAAPASTAGGLLAVSEPAGATLLINNQIRGETPLLLQDLEPGQYNVELQRNGFTSYTQQVVVTAGRVVRVSGQLQPLNGSLTLVVRPRGSIYIDGVLRATDTDQPFKIDLPIGTHQVRATHPTLGKWEQTIEITGSAPLHHEVNFQQAPETRQTYALPEQNLASASPTQASSRSPSRPPAVKINLDSVYAFPETPPQLLSGRNTINTIADYPKLAARNRVEGKVFLQFIVDEKGRVQQERVTRGIGSGCDEEALRLIRLARFKPAQIQGQAVKSWHAMFIRFQLSPEK